MPENFIEQKPEVKKYAGMLADLTEVKRKLKESGRKGEEVAEALKNLQEVWDSVYERVEIYEASKAYQFLLPLFQKKVGGREHMAQECIDDIRDKIKEYKSQGNPYDENRIHEIIKEHLKQWFESDPEIFGDPLLFEFNADWSAIELNKMAKLEYFQPMDRKTLKKLKKILIAEFNFEELMKS